MKVNWRWLLPLGLVVVGIVAWVVVELRPGSLLAPATPTPTSPPQVVEIKAEPAQLPYRGGKVQLVAQVQAGAGVEAVTVSLVKEGKETARVAGEQDGGGWRAVVELPPNIRTDGQAITYQVKVQVVDVLGQSGSGEGQVRVLAPELPPQLSF